jgi:exonuclease SbcC
VLLIARREVTTVTAERDAGLAERGTLAARAATLPDELATLRSRLDEARRTAARREALGLALQRADDQAAAASRLPAAEAELDESRDAARQTRDEAADAREHLHDLIASRLAGMAAELAGRLSDGTPCQVCGSTTHPHPAPPSDDAVTAEQHQQASDAYDRAAARHTAAVRRATEAEQRLEALRAVSGGLEAEAAALEVDRLSAELTAAAAAEQLGAELALEEAGLLGEQEQVFAELHRVDSALAALDVRLERLARDVAEIAAEIRSVTDPDGEAGDDDLPLADLIGRLSEHRDRLRDAGAALAESEEARTRLRDVRRQALRSVGEHGFPDVEACRRAVLTPAERAQHDRLLADRGAARARAEAILEAPDVEELATAEAPDLDALRSRLTESEASAATASRAHHQAEDAAAALDDQLRLLAEALERWAPAREEHTRAEAMAKLVRGMGGDNQLQMRLSAYVLATRLDQVVDAANERLAQMRDQRYLLQRTGRAQRRGSQAGLGLEVVDQWTGETREPTSLSGGETFVVSLSLALGLADVVTNEAGGTEVETLFVDEGFGSLDADTLDDVMDRLDGLRAGGRTVGVVSHVAEMRNRIPTQVHVDKRRTGSAIAVRTLVG